MKDIENEIKNIIERNKRVELDKAWETSIMRTIILTVITYVLASLLLFVIKNQNPLINALVPTLGYFLSFQTLPFIKRWWINKKIK